MEKRRQRFLTAFELSRLADECGDYRPFVWFLGWSGLRLGEAVALRAGKVDGRRVRVEESATEIDGHGLTFGPTKTHETRIVILPNFVAQELRAALEDKADDELIFTASRGGPLRAGNFRKRVFNPAAERIGIPDLLIHDLRDTAASLAISTGASIKAVQRMLGHASAAMTLDTYGGRGWLRSLAGREVLEEGVVASGSPMAPVLGLYLERLSYASGSGRSAANASTISVAAGSDRTR